MTILGEVASPPPLGYEEALATDTLTPHSKKTLTGQLSSYQHHPHTLATYPLFWCMYRTWLYVVSVFAGTSQLLLGDMILRYLYIHVRCVYIIQGSLPVVVVCKA